jgi:nucleoside 2-deoxyribosyltransferase
MTTVYLAGGINGLSDGSAKGWRREATWLLKASGCDVLDPMRRDYRGRESDSAADIVDGDKADILSSSIVIARAHVPSWGTAMEILFAYENGRRVIAWVDQAQSVSPWISYHSTVVTSLKRAVEEACQ